jgi:aldose 1-epimerase
MTRAPEPAAAEYFRSRCGTLTDGRDIEAITLTNSSGFTVRILSLGATVQSILAPDARGACADVALGLAGAAEYQKNREYFGVTLGRYANRIANGRFSLDGRSYQLATNDGPNCLHGGIGGFGRALWTVASLKRGASAGVTLTLDSPDGDDGFPGALRVSAAFELVDHRLEIHYRATTDAPTIVNLSNHTYFNLGGEDSERGIERHRLTIPADAYLPVDSTSIPTGELRPVGGTPFDFRSPMPVGRHLRDGRDTQLRIGRGYDHCWVVGESTVAEPKLVACMADPDSGRMLEVFSSQPGLQFYSGNSLDGSAVGKSGRAYRQGDGFALEPQRFPDTPNQPLFGSARLLPRDVYEHRIIYRFSATAGLGAGTDMSESA